MLYVVKHIGGRRAHSLGSTSPFTRLHSHPAKLDGQQRPSTKLNAVCFRASDCLLSNTRTAMAHPETTPTKRGSDDNWNTPPSKDVRVANGIQTHNPYAGCGAHIVSSKIPEIYAVLNRHTQSAYDTNGITRVHLAILHPIGIRITKGVEKGIHSTPSTFPRLAQHGQKASRSTGESDQRCYPPSYIAVFSSLDPW